MRRARREESMEMMPEAGCSQSVIDHCLSVTVIAIRVADARAKFLVIACLSTCRP